MKLYPFDESQGEFREVEKEFTKEELYDQYATNNDVPEVAQNYIDELESKIKYKKQLKELVAEIEVLQYDVSTFHDTEDELKLDRKLNELLTKIKEL